MANSSTTRFTNIFSTPLITQQLEDAAELNTSLRERILAHEADLIAFAIFRHFEHRDSKYFDVIRHCFDEDGGVVHGLHVFERNAGRPDNQGNGLPAVQNWLPKSMPYGRSETYASE